mgnify:CR=1 FL=1
MSEADVFKEVVFLTWEEYYDKFYDWAESTQVNKLSAVDSLGPADEVAEIMLEFAFNREDIVNRIARKAIEQKLVFSAENIQDLTNFMDGDLHKQLALQSARSFSKEDLVMLEGFLDDDVLVQLYKLKGIPIPEILADDEPEPIQIPRGKKKKKGPSGFFEKVAMAFAIGEGVRLGIKDATEGKKNDRHKL